MCKYNSNTVVMTLLLSLSMRTTVGISHTRGTLVLLVCDVELTLLLLLTRSQHSQLLGDNVSTHNTQSHQECICSLSV